MSFVPELPCGCLCFDEQRVILEANDAAARLLECDRASLPGQRLSAFLPVASLMFLQSHVFPALIEHGSLDEIYLSLQTVARTEVPVLMSVRRVQADAGHDDKGHYLCAFQPMRRRQLAERELIHFREAADRAALAEQEALSQVREVQAQLAFQDRLAAIGTLAAGVAHEINNPLTFVMGNLLVLGERLQAAQRGEGTLGDDLSALLTETHDGVERIRGIVVSLRSLSRVDQGESAPVDLATVVAHAQRLAAHEVRPRGTLTIDIPSPAPVVTGDEGRLVQVLVNLLVNAAHAMPARPVDANHIIVRARALGTGVARIEVEDNGSGMSSAVQARIFEPFFTTKPAGVGTGLGLSICRGIIASLGGTIEFVSLEGEGTVVRVMLPLAAAPAATGTKHPPATTPRPATSAVEPPGPAADAVQAPGRVLIVDDEESVVRTLERILDRFAVTSVTSGAEAVRRIQAGETFDVILCDLMMPGVSGMDVHAATMQVSPDLAARMVFMTGGTYTDRASHFLRTITNAHMAKPFHPRTVRDTCARVMQSPLPPLPPGMR